jgi:hypothetical protein
VFKALGGWTEWSFIAGEFRPYEIPLITLIICGKSGKPDGGKRVSGDAWQAENQSYLRLDVMRFCPDGWQIRIG